MWTWRVGEHYSEDDVGDRLFRLRRASLRGGSGCSPFREVSVGRSADDEGLLAELCGAGDVGQVRRVSSCLCK